MKKNHKQLCGFFPFRRPKPKKKRKTNLWGMMIARNSGVYILKVSEMMIGTTVGVCWWSVRRPEYADDVERQEYDDDDRYDGRSMMMIFSTVSVKVVAPTIFSQKYNLISVIVSYYASVICIYYIIITY